MSYRLHRFDTGQLDEEKKTKLLIEVLRFPIKKGIMTFLFSILQITVLAVFLRIQFNFSIKNLVVFSFICLLMTNFIILAVFDAIQTSCSKKATSIVSSGVSESYVGSKKYLGFSLITLFILYVIIPFITSGITVYLSSLSSNILKSVVISAINLIFTTLYALIYFRKIKKYTGRVQEALHSLSDKNIKNSNIIPVDLSTELSYTIYTVNQTIKFFTSIIEQTSLTNEEINIASQNLSSISEETASTSIEQSTAVKEIVSTMEMTEELSQSIEH
ncbi:MAG: hypothetical protein J6S91_06725, partial [Treponema sp.]|nr:hypothetical protein [Treponema sp.]